MELRMSTLPEAPRVRRGHARSAPFRALTKRQLKQWIVVHGVDSFQASAEFARH
jgi:hypothetical protein